MSDLAILFLIAAVWVTGIVCLQLVDDLKAGAYIVFWPIVFVLAAISYSWDRWGVKRHDWWIGGSRFLTPESRMRAWIFRIPWTRGWAIGLVNVAKGVEKCETCTGTGRGGLDADGRCRPCNGTGKRTISMKID